MSKKRGKFIVIEGVDGSGKSTLSESLKERLPQSVLLREPTNNSPFSKELREILSGNKTSTEDNIRDLFMKDRIWDIENNILPEIEKGKDVILDRYFYSTAAYQGKDKNDIYTIMEHYLKSSGILKPDVLFYIKIDIETVLNRLNKRNKHLEIFEKKERLLKTISHYDYIFTTFHLDTSFFIIDGKATPHTICDFCLEKLSLIQ